MARVRTTEKERDVPSDEEEEELSLLLLPLLRGERFLLLEDLDEELSLLE